MRAALPLLILTIGALSQDKIPWDMLRSTDPVWRAAGIRHCKSIETGAAAAAILGLHGDGHRRILREAADALARMPGPEVEKVLTGTGLKARAPTARWLALEAIAIRGPMLRGKDGKAEKGRLASAVRALVEDRDDQVRVATMIAIARLRVYEAREEVASRLAEDRHWEVRAEAALALGAISGPDALPQLEAALEDKDGRVRGAVLEALVVIDLGKGLESARRAIFDDDWRTRCTASWIIAKDGGAEGVGALIKGLEGAEGRTIRDLLFALKKLTGKDLGDDPAPWRGWWEANRSRWKRYDEEELLDHGPRTVTRKTAIKYYDIPVWSERVVFVVDLSESMGKKAPGEETKTRADVAKEELKRAIEGLPRSARFNIVVFRTKVELLSSKPLKPTGKNVASLIKKMGKPRGGTNIFDALEQAILIGGGDTVCLLTDGAPSEGTFRNKTEILEEIERLNRYRKVRIHCIGIGSTEVSKRWGGFLKKLAEKTNGESVTRN